MKNPARVKVWTFSMSEVEEDPDLPTLQPAEEVVNKSIPSSTDYNPPTELKYLEPGTKTSWTRVTTQMEMMRNGTLKGFGALDIRGKGTPEYKRANGEDLVKNLQRKARTINHVVRRVVLNKNLQQIMETVAVLNWNTITREIQEWAAWKMVREEKQKVMG